MRFLSSPPPLRQSSIVSNDLRRVCAASNFSKTRAFSFSAACTFSAVRERSECCLERCCSSVLTASKLLCSVFSFCWVSSSLQRSCELSEASFKSLLGIFASKSFTFVRNVSRSRIQFWNFFSSDDTRFVYSSEDCKLLVLTKACSSLLRSCNSAFCLSDCSRRNSLASTMLFNSEIRFKSFSISSSDCESIESMDISEGSRQCPLRPVSNELLAAMGGKEIVVFSAFLSSFKGLVRVVVLAVLEASPLGLEIISISDDVAVSISSLELGGEVSLLLLREIFFIS
ncbi:hypothetical protein FF38_12856 [Lucilia cuprina]|uniref:Uncharacterized protein n=1 Tax=Lucilia cuprina TaxID=7375 RepID=A0A0L0BUU7_LUCCU|nr:hypothetical protein FF38_12856 [Lucilia cuprina]